MSLAKLKMKIKIKIKIYVEQQKLNSLLRQYHEECLKLNRDNVYGPARISNTRPNRIPEYVDMTASSEENGGGNSADTQCTSRLVGWPQLVYRSQNRPKSNLIALSKLVFS